MNDLPATPPEPSVHRCPNCDSVVQADATQCLMCGVELPSPIVPEAELEMETAVSTPSPAPEIVTSIMRERQSPATFWLTAVFAVIIIVLSALVLRYQAPVVAFSLVPTETPIPPTPTYTPVWTPLPTETGRPTDMPAMTPTSAPTATPQPPRAHTVTSGETLIGLALRFRVSVASIAALNGFSPDAPLQLNQELQIPWPTPTPPLVPVGVTVNGELVIAEPKQCLQDRYEVVSGDSLSSIAARHNVDFELFLLVNRLTAESILQPGDLVCIPEIVYGATLQPTPGPSPTPSLTPPPPGPQLLYPVDNTAIESVDMIITLQWTAVKDLAQTEWYMAELKDLSQVDSLPYRGFTRDTSFQVPHSWRPAVEETRPFRWRISVVQVTGWRSDGQPIYTYGGESSQPAFFTWLGAIPTPTPTATPEP